MDLRWTSSQPRSPASLRGARDRNLNLKILLCLLFAITTTAAQARQASSQDINPGLKQPAPIPSTCPAGKHWTTQGSGIAHCVLDDPACSSGTYLVHDTLGNPSCVAPIVETETRTRSCGSGYTGKKWQRRTKTTLPDGTVKYSTWNTYNDTCEAVPVPPAAPDPECTNGATNYPACNNNSSPTTPSNPTNPPCSNGATNYPSCNNSSAPNDPPCANGATNYPVCNNNSTPPCPNGATNYPACNDNEPRCPNGASNWPSCNNNLPLPSSCPAPEKWCMFDLQSSGEYTLGEYTWGVNSYSGPTCSMSTNTHGSCPQNLQYGDRNGYCTGCPNGY